MGGETVLLPLLVPARHRAAYGDFPLVTERPTGGGERSSLFTGSKSFSVLKQRQPFYAVELRQ